MSFATAASLTKRIMDGEGADVVILTSAGIADLTRQGKLIAGSRVELTRASIGVAIRRRSRRKVWSQNNGYRFSLEPFRAGFWGSGGGGAAVGAAAGGGGLVSRSSSSTILVLTVPRLGALGARAT